MDRKYACYCGLYCENCAVKVKVEPAAKVLYEELKKTGIEEDEHLKHDDIEFWSLLKRMAVDGVCTSCKYIGLYCHNCAVKVKVEPAAKVLYEEMEKLGFEEIMPFFPDGEKFWSFLKGMSTEGVCVSCRAGSGNPGCKIRLCAKEKNLEMCALCESYPCGHFPEFFEGYPMLQHDNSVLRENGWESWGKLQDERRAKGSGFAYDKNSNEQDKNDG